MRISSLDCLFQDQRRVLFEKKFKVNSLDIVKSTETVKRAPAPPNNSPGVTACFSTTSTETGGIRAKATPNWPFHKLQEVNVQATQADDYCTA